MLKKDPHGLTIVNQFLVKEVVLNKEKGLRVKKDG